MTLSNPQSNRPKSFQFILFVFSNLLILLHSESANARQYLARYDNSTYLYSIQNNLTRRLFSVHSASVSRSGDQLCNSKNSGSPILLMRCIKEIINTDSISDYDFYKPRNIKDVLGPGVALSKETEFHTIMFSKSFRADGDVYNVYGSIYTYNGRKKVNWSVHFSINKNLKYSNIVDIFGNNWSEIMEDFVGQPFVHIILPTPTNIMGNKRIRYSQDNHDIRIRFDGDAAVQDIHFLIMEK